MIFANLSLQTPDSDLVFELLDEAPAFVSPAILGWVTVFDSWADDGDVARLADTGVVLSEALQCRAIGFLVIDETLLMFVFDRGEVVEEYASAPDVFGELSADQRALVSGQVEALVPLTVPGAKLETLSQALHRRGLAPVERLLLLGKVLGLENVALGYRQLLNKAEGRTNPEVLGWDLFAHAELGDIDGPEHGSL